MIESSKKTAKLASTGIGQRAVCKAAILERTTWGLVLVLLVLLIGVVLVFDRRGGSEVASDDSPRVDERKPTDLPTSTSENVESILRVDLSPRKKAESRSTVTAQVPKKRPDSDQESVVVNVKPKTAPRETPETGEKNIVPLQTAPAREGADAKPSLKTPPTKTDQPQVPSAEFANAAFLPTPLPDVGRAAVAPGRPVTLLTFPRPPEQIKLELLGLEWLNTNAQRPPESPRPKLTATYSPLENTFAIHDASGATRQEIAMFFIQKNELRFKWKPRASLIAIQRLLRAHAVLHATWKGHPGRYYALHESHARDARRIRDQQVRFRPSELPTLVDPDHLFLGQGKLEIADVYSHRFLVVPKAKRLELPTLTRSRKDPPVFVMLEWHDRSLSLKLDSPVNDEEDAKRRRRLFEHVDGNFHLHASLYRVVDDRVKVEVLRLGTP